MKREGIWQKYLNVKQPSTERLEFSKIQINSYLISSTFTGPLDMTRKWQ